MSKPVVRGWELVAFTSALAAFGCSNGDATGSGGAATGSAATAMTNGSAGTSMSTSTSSASGGAGAGGGTLGGPFRRGMNFGYVPGFTNQDNAKLSHDVGANGARVSFPESFFAKWGYDIEVNNNIAYQADGITSNVAFLTSPTREHSSASANVSDGDLVFYIPNDLYQPIFLGDGSVNPANSWATYVEHTVTTYKDYVRVYSVWNEPDWVSDWQVVDGWKTSPPTKDQLPRFNGSIYDYVRMLRITSEVAKHVDSGVKVAVGGLGYAPFLSAVLRYTDDPNGGGVSSEFPKTGASYFDVVDMHYYPIFSPGNSDAGVDGLIKERDDFQATLDAANAGPRAFVVTESGAPRVAVGNAPGGEDYAKNYIVKAMVTAQAKGISGIDWFILSDGADPMTSSFSSMGCYENLSGQTPATAKRTPTGEAYRTLGAVLDGAGFDPTATTALALPGDVRGAAFVTKAGKKAMVLWAYAAGTTETANATYSLVTTAPWSSFGWDAAKTGMTPKTLTPTNGAISVSLDSTPVYLVEP